MKTYIHTESYTQIFVALFRIALNWKQLRSPSTNEWLNTLGYPYHGMPLCNEMEQIG